MRIRPNKKLAAWLSAAGLLGAACAVTAADTDAALSALPYTPSLDLTAMDTGAKACTDFYQYACGGWIKNNPIPPDQASWSVYGKLFDDNQRFLRGILEDLAQRPQLDAAQQQLGDYYAACMDQDAVDRAGLAPLRESMDRIAALQSKEGLPALLAELHATGSDAFFGFGSGQDYGDASQVIAEAGAGGLSLPDRDYYTKTDTRSKTLRSQYRRHLVRMFTLAGDAPAAAQQQAATVLAIEIALARASLTKVELRDPKKLYHPMDARALQALTPGFDWAMYLKTLGLASAERFNVSEPAFFQALEQQWRKAPLADIKTYLRWHLLHARAPYLGTAVVDENFAFFRKTLLGVPAIKPRWKRCVALTDAQLGDALGKVFVDRTFSAQTRQDTLRMATRIEQAMRDDLRQLDWMSAPTKARAMEKLDTLINKIGYPDRWRDYDGLVVKRDDFAGNIERGTQFESRRDLAKIGKPLDRGEWQMTPPTVNAYYDAQMNDINFPAGVLQPPLYDPRMDAAPNYGNTGSTIGHELTHAFDDEGRQFDAQGNLKNWWQPADAKAFERRAKCVVDQYARYTVIDNIKINSKLSEGEDIADLGGLVLAWMAWKAETAGQVLQPRDGLAPEQRFFVGYAQWACENKRPEKMRLDAQVNPHSPGRYRVNGLMVNTPEFQQAFDCKAGQPMVSARRCHVW